MNRFYLATLLLLLGFSSIKAQQASSLVMNKEVVLLQMKKNSTATVKLKLKNNSDSSVKWKAYTKGAEVFYSKKGFTKWQKPKNQDSISADVRIARGNRKSFYNGVSERSHDPNISPAGTLWVLGKTVNATDAVYLPFRKAFRKPIQVIDHTISLKLEKENRYFDVVLKTFSGGKNGGGFSYIRTEINPQWITLNKNEETLEAGKKSKLSITIDNTSLLLGTHHLNLVIFEPDNPSNQIEIPITVAVTSK